MNRTPDECYQALDDAAERFRAMTNPDNEVYQGLHPDGYMPPQKGALRFVDRDGERRLQRYEWSRIKGKYDWFDVPYVRESDE